MSFFFLWFVYDLQMIYKCVHSKYPKCLWNLLTRLSSRKLPCDHKLRPKLQRLEKGIKFMNNSLSHSCDKSIATLKANWTWLTIVQSQQINALDVGCGSSFHGSLTQ